MFSVRRSTCDVSVAPNEHLRTVHPPSGGHFAAGDWIVHDGHRRLSAYLPGWLRCRAWIRRSSRFPPPCPARTPATHLASSVAAPLEKPAGPDFRAVNENDQRQHAWAARGLRCNSATSATVTSTARPATCRPPSTPHGTTSRSTFPARLPIARSIPPMRPS